MNLVPIKVTSDGSCLPHSLSRAMAGYEVFYDALRASLVQELTLHADWYKEHLPERINPESRMDDLEWAKHWRGIVHAAQPTHGATVGIEKYLSGVHILAMANMLQRPILLLDIPSRMEAVSPHAIDGCGLYLPCRHSREDIIKTHNRPLSPLMIAWQGPARDHFVALAQQRMSLAATLETLSSRPVELLGWVTLMDEVNSIPDEAIQMAFCAIIETNSPCARDAACQTLRIVLDNIGRYVRDPVEANRKYCMLRLDRPAVKHSIVGVNGALALLKAVGFCENVVDGVPSMVYPTDLPEARDLTRYHAALHTLLGCFTQTQSSCAATRPLVELYNAPFPGLCEVSDEAMMQRLFGHSPLMVDSWREAVNRFGTGDLKHGRVWSLDTGRDATSLVVDMIKRASKSFQVLSRGQFGREGWSPRLRNAMENVADAALVVCPVCTDVSQFPVSRDLGVEQLEYSLNLEAMSGMSPDLSVCQTCLFFGRLTLLSVKHTLYIRVLEMLKSSFSESTRAWKCDNSTCGVANLDVDHRCTICRAPRPVKPPQEKRKEVAEGDPLNSEAAPLKRINTQSHEISSEVNWTGRADTGGSHTEEKGSHPSHAKWTCLICRFPNEDLHAACSNCLTPRGQTPSWVTTSTPEHSMEQLGSEGSAPGKQESEDSSSEPSIGHKHVHESPFPDLIRAKTEHSRVAYAVVYHTSLLKDSRGGSDLSQSSNLPVHQKALEDIDVSLPPPIAATARGLSQPVTEFEISFATHSLSEATRTLEQMWKETRSILFSESPEADGEGEISLAIHLE